MPCLNELPSWFAMSTAQERVIGHSLNHIVVSSLVFSICLSCLWSLLVMPRSALLVSWMVLLEPPMVATFEGLTHSGKVDKHVKANCLNQLMWSDLKEVFYLRLGWHLIPLVFSVNLCCSNQSRNLSLYGSTVRLWWVKSSYVSYMRALGKSTEQS